MSSSTTPSSPTTAQPASPANELQIENFGEAAVIVILGNTIVEANYRRLAELAKAITLNPPAGFSELVPAYNSLLVVFDPLLSTTDTMRAAVWKLAATMDSVVSDTTKDILELPVAYGGEYGPDLEEVANHAGLSVEEAIRIHSSSPYLVYMLGFTPGFPYLGGLDPRIATPRLKTPRTKVPAGSVGIADTQTGVYPLESPGGWNLIGRTPLALFDPGRETPALLAPGKYVRFVPISQDSFRQLHQVKVNREPVKDSVQVSDPGSKQLSSRSIVILKPGSLSTVQDAGRFGYQASGVPPSGPMDEFCMSLANILAGNEAGAACIECTLGGLELRFDTDCVFALAGADTPIFLNDQSVSMHVTLKAQAGAILRLGLATTGLRVYLAVHGGINVPAILGSKATFQRGGFGGLEGRALAAGDSISLGIPPSLSSELLPDQALTPKFSPEITVRAILSHEADRFTAVGLARFFSATYTVSPKSDRMGCRLEGPVIEHSRGADIISSGVLTGTIQVPGDGQPIVLMAERQTTGGYTRIAHVIRADLPLLGQARPGDRVRFVQTTAEEATLAFAEKQKLLEQIKTARHNEERADKLEAVWHFQVNVDGQAYSVTVEAVK